MLLTVVLGRVFKSALFAKAARKARIGDNELLRAIAQVMAERRAAGKMEVDDGLTSPQLSLAIELTEVSDVSHRQRRNPRTS